MIILSKSTCVIQLNCAAFYAGTFIKEKKPGAVAYACNPTTFGGLRWADGLSPGVRDQPRQHDKPCLYKNKKISWAWWRAPVIPATQEAEAGESLEPGRWRGFHQQQTCSIRNAKGSFSL